MNKIKIKETYISGSYLLNGNVMTSHAMVGETLAADQLVFVVNTEHQPYTPADQEYPFITEDNQLFFAKSDIDVKEFRDGDEVLYFESENLVGKYFFESIVQQSRDHWKITATSIIGRLLNSRHYGGIYTNVPASQIFADILGGASYFLDPAVASATVSGYLPIAVRRDNLQQLLVATGASVRIDDAGTVYITAMSPVQTGVFTADRVFLGGSVKTDKPVVGVKLTEHNYFPDGKVVTLFDDGVDGEEVIEFKEPYHSLTIEGGELAESGANFARIRASGAVVLTGKPYTHVTRVVTAGTVDTGSTENVKTVSSCYLANPQIAQAIADRFYAYLKCNRTISQDVLMGTERAGDVVSVINPYTMEMETATIKRLDMTMGSVNKARAEFVVGFTPQGSLSGFKNYALLTGNGSWTVPGGVDKIRVILVGGGSGGTGGYNGKAGSIGSWSKGAGSSSDGAGGNPEPGDGGDGGAAGKRGAGGRVFEISVDVTPGQMFDFNCGIGGKGGAANGGDATAGTATVFGEHSSDYGRLYQYGYNEVQTGITFAAAGLDGFDGGRGGKASAQYGVPSWGEYYYGEDGEGVNGFAGGKGGLSKRVFSGSDDMITTDYYGGGGGGAANGASGGSGDSGYAGSGATGLPGAHGVNYGQGGGAGNGGGGGGGGGMSKYHNGSGGFRNPTYYYVYGGGSGGIGTAGGNGADGAIVIYY